MTPSLQIFLHPSPILAGLSALLALVIAVVVLDRNPRRIENQAFFALVILSVLSNLNAASIFFSDHPDPLSSPRLQFVFAFGGLSLYALTIFAEAFPFNRRPSRLLVGGLGLLAVVHFLLSVRRFESEGAVWFSRSYYALCGLLAFGFAVRNYRALQTPLERAGLLLIHSVFVTRIVLSGLAYAPLREDGQPLFGLLVVQLIIAPPLLAAALGYGLTRFQMLGLRFFLSRSLAYFIVAGGALVLYVGFISGLHAWLRRLLDIDGASIFTAPVLLTILLVTFHPVRMRVEEVLDRWLDQSAVRARAAAEDYFKRSRNALGLRALHRVVRDTARSILPTSRLAMLVARPSPRLLTADGLTRFLPAGWTGEVGTVTGELTAGIDDAPDEVVDLPDAAALFQYFEQTRRSHLLRTARREFPADAPPVLSRLRADLIIPFWREGMVDGLLLLQAPEVDRERVRLLIEVARHLGLQLENTLLYQQAIEANEALTREKGELEDTRRFLESLFEAVPAGLAVVDGAGQVVRWNRGMERLTGITRSTALRADVLELIPGLGLHGEDTQAARGMTAPLQRRLHFEGAEGETIVHLRLAFFKDSRGGLAGTVLILTDVTQQVAMQEALEASKRLAALGQFAAAMAHEIRTPMTSIQMNVQILAGKVELPPEDYEYFDIILTELDRLNRTVGEILDFARPMRLNAADLELRDLVEEVVRGLYFLLAERGVEVEQSLPAGLTVRADGERLKQVLINLLDNASHAIEEDPKRREGPGPEPASEPGVVRVQARPMKQGVVPGVLLEVVDQGCGIPEETLRHIFDPFYTTRPKGTGLGLAIAKKIVDAHGGEISAESEPGKGSTFRIWLPAGRG